MMRFALPHLWQSTLVAGAVALLLIALSRATARTRYGLCLLASIKFLVPLAPFVAVGGALAARTTTWPDVALVAWLDRSLALQPLDANPSVAAGSAALLGGWAFALCGAIWLAGVLVVARRRWREWRDVAALVASSTRIGEGRETEALRRACARVRSTRRIELRQCPSAIEPGVAGFVSPRILWPAGLSDRLSDEQLEAILAHEVCHVVRRDNLRAAVQMAVEIVFWFHPLVWWIGARMLSERERACDEEVLRMGTDERSYAEGILKVCGFCLRAPAALRMGIGAGIRVSNLTRRIERILTSPPCTPTLRGRLLVPALLIVTAGAPIAAGAARGGLETPQQAGQSDRRDDGVVLPRVVTSVPPSYTARAMSARIQGTVILEAVVLETGRVGDVRIVRSLDTEHGLDDQAIAALRQWRFEPATRDGKAVPMRVTVEMSFTLRRSPKD